MRLVSSASSARQDGSYPFRPIKSSPAEPQPTGLLPQPDLGCREPSGPADANPSASQRWQQDSTDIRPPRSRPNSRRSIGGAALRVPRPGTPAAAARPAASVVLALPDVSGDHASFSGRPPKPRRTSSLSMHSGRGPSASGASWLQEDQPLPRRPSALGGVNPESTLCTRRFQHAALRHLCCCQMMYERARCRRQGKLPQQWDELWTVFWGQRRQRRVYVGAHSAGADSR